MESRTFIKTATALRKEIADFLKADLTAEEAHAHGGALQKDIHAAFQGLQNPTLPSAEKLCSEATAAGFSVNPMVMQRITQAQHIWTM